MLWWCRTLLCPLLRLSLRTSGDVLPAPDSGSHETGTGQTLATALSLSLWPTSGNNLVLDLMYFNFKNWIFIVRQLTPEEAERSRFDNFYNNYNIDWHSESPCCKSCCKAPEQSRKSRCCEDYTKQDDCCPAPGCPTGFKPCTMRLTPPPCCDPCGVWCAQVQPCPPKAKKKTNIYQPGPCCRPCCKHWKPKEPPCLYDDPCKADCFNHPPGMKPSGRYPWCSCVVRRQNVFV